jgi:hypothetical protein
MQIKEILDRVDNLEIVMPEFQREYVWSKDQAKELMVSLFSDYPTGSLLFWNASSENAPEVKNKAINRDKLGMVDIILDGQQRVTTLYMLIEGKIPPYYKKRDIGKDPRNLYFNLKTGQFLYHMKTKMDGNVLWQKVVDCFGDSEINAISIAKKYVDKHQGDFEAIASEINDNLMKLRNINEKEYPVQRVPSNAQIDEAIDVFDRVNSQGTKLTDAELVLTHITGKWPEARRQFKEKQNELKAEFFDFNLDFLTRCMVIELTGSARLNDNAKLDYDKFEKSDYINAWQKLHKTLDYLIPVLRQDGYLSSSNDVSTNNVFIPLVAYLLNNDIRFEEERKFGFLYWMFLASAWRRYSGQTPQKLDKDSNIAINSSNPIVDLVREIEDDRGRIEVKASDLEGRGTSHPMYKMLYIATKYVGAIDWSNGGPITETKGDYYSIQSHHIFPTSLLYEKKYDPSNHLDQKKVNEIANRAFITRDSNYSISNNNPTEYLEEIKEKYPSALKKQFIPQSEKLWELDNYEEFLKARRSKIAKQINSFLNELKASYQKMGDERKRDWLERIKKGESNYVEFKSSIRWDYHQNKPNKDLEYDIAKAIAGFMNTEGGTLFIGVNDQGEILGLEKDYKTLGRKQDKDGFLLAIDNIVNEYLGKEFTEHLTIEVDKVEDKDICIVEVSDSDTEVYVKKDHNEEFYVRASASTQPLTVREANEYINKHFN